ncbi:polysaccharide export protein [Candidatus Koribacter versatilis Ellin345]|uniref:Polysaccharide export protein n=1 Tax=Koribacter versatilis (strain Ellin345) TaxID=204669 RepID=Q1IN17_KORVE|nr:polysaccharide export protein [Candidatus Koribacter versatilis Ellin345]
MRTATRLQKHLAVAIFKGSLPKVIVVAVLLAIGASPQLLAQRAECGTANCAATVKVVDSKPTEKPNQIVTTETPDVVQVQTSRPPKQVEKPSEFERYVEESLGYALPLFGRKLFADPPSTFAPLTEVPAPAEYVIGPGDELVIRGWGQVQIEARVTVDRSGQVFLPKVGAISVAGVHYADLRRHLQASVQRVFHDFELEVSLGQLRSMQIFVVGQARQAGTYTVSSLSTAVTAAFATGGPSPQGSLRKIEVRRGGATITTLDLYEFLLKGDKSHDVALLPGDVIYIPPVGQMVAISGSVNTPGIYELLPGTTLSDAVELAGGLTATADDERVSVERIEEHRTRRVFEVAPSVAEPRFVLENGDVVRVLAISKVIEDAVTLRGNVARPGRYRWHPRMRIQDLIPNREFLLTPEYWSHKNALVREGVGESKNAEERTLTELKQNAPPLNWEYAAVERSDPERLNSEVLPFNLGGAIDGDSEANLLLKAGDVVTIFSERDIQVSNAKRTKLVRLEGEFAAPGVYRAEPGETLRALVGRVGLTPDSYLFGAEFTRESTRMQQQQGLDRLISEMENGIQEIHTQRADANDGAAVQEREAQEARRGLVARVKSLRASGRIVLALPPAAHDVREIPEIVLEDGDRFVVPHTPATVSVTGEVFNQGAFLFNRNLKVRDYLRDAGGGTRNADASRIFVLRADGTVVSRQHEGGRFDGLPVYAGDTIISPVRLEKGNFMRGLRDWSQVISQFALGAAAIKVLE